MLRSCTNSQVANYTAFYKNPNSVFKCTQMQIAAVAATMDLSVFKQRPVIHFQLEPLRFKGLIITKKLNFFEILCRLKLKDLYHSWFVFTKVHQNSPDSHIIWAGSGFYLAVSGIHLIRFCQIKTRSEIELAQTQSFRSTMQINTRSDIELPLTQSFCHVTPDQNQIRYRTGSKSIVLTYYVGSKPDQKLNWLNLEFFNVQCQIKMRSGIELSQTKSFCPLTPDQNLILYQTGSNSII